MGKTTSSFITLFTKIAGWAFLAVLVVGIFLPVPEFYALVSGNLLSLLFVGSNLLVVQKIDLGDHKRFLYIFFTSMVVRFILVICSILFVLKVVKIHQIYFTVSFIISYIFHSVIEIIFINKILETDN